MPGARYPDCDADVLEMIADELGEVIGTAPEYRRGARAAWALAQVAAEHIRSLRAELSELRASLPALGRVR
jgi:hypothetical protein